MNYLKSVGLKNIHPRLYRTIPEFSLFGLSVEKDQSDHIWIQSGRMVFTTQPKGDGLYDNFWNYWDSLTKPLFTRSKKSE